MTHLDLFSGIGGFTIAAQWAGLETVGFSEIEPYCCKLLAEKWPEIPNYGDIRTADFSGLRGSVTVLSAGVPCQPASLAGKRRGKDDDRWLWETTLDVVESVQPAYAIFENPPGILTLDEFGGVLLRLESLGYAVRAFSVPANAVGAKHRRQRVFIVAHAESERSGWGRNGRRGNNGGGTLHEAAGSGEDAETLADADLQRTERGERICGNAPATKRDLFSGCGEALADADGTGSQTRSTVQRRPEPDGAQQSITERYMWRLTEPPLCGATPRIPNRSHRLKALGNAVVPQQAYPFFAAIAQVESGL